MAKECGYNPSNKLRKGQSNSPVKTPVRDFHKAAGRTGGKVSVNRGTSRMDIPTPKGR